MSGFSESYFMSFFRQYVGMSCISYINHYRIQKAAHALEETSGPVMEIAMDHGFDNISYFNLQFRREFGMTPRQFRMRQKEDA
jgi:AraC-like DNA-binding protein